MNEQNGAGEHSGHILIVEDEETSREYFSSALTAAGFNVKTAGTGAEAIRMWEKESFEVLLTDLILPDMHGRDLAACILSMSPAVEIIMVTGHPSADNTAGNLIPWGSIPRPLGRSMFFGIPLIPRCLRRGSSFR